MYSYIDIDRGRDKEIYKYTEQNTVYNWSIYLDLLGGSRNTFWSLAALLAVVNEVDLKCENYNSGTVFRMMPPLCLLR